MCSTGGAVSGEEVLKKKCSRSREAFWRRNHFPSKAVAQDKTSTHLISSSFQLDFKENL
jgi:hypothetical protein